MISVLNVFTIINLTLLGALLFFKRNGSVTTKLLGLIIFIPATPFATNYFMYTGLMNKYPILLFICVNYLWAPVVLWYVMLMLGKEVKITYKKIIHLVPYFILLSCYIAWFVQDDAYIQETLNNVFHGIFPWQLMLLNFGLLIQSFSYLIYSYVQTKKYLKKHENSGEGAEQVVAKVKWVKQFLQILLGLAVIAILLSLVLPMADVTYIYIPFLYDIAFYIVIYGAIRHTTLFSSSEFQNYVLAEKQNKEKYASSSISPAQLEESYLKLIACLNTEKLFLNPEISLKELSSNINYPQHVVSQVINQKFNKNFFDLINSYRVEEAKNRLKSINQSNLTIEGIGSECGFGSPSAFYRAFKKHTGSTPNQFVKQQ